MGNVEGFECQGDCIHINETEICKKCGIGDDFKYEPKGKSDDE